MAVDCPTDEQDTERATHSEVSRKQSQKGPPLLHYMQRELTLLFQESGSSLGKSLKKYLGFIV
jgi:hypothetical protein